MHLKENIGPPYPGCQGKWVDREDFTGLKSFGYFLCLNCFSCWTSAHAQVRYRQGCTKCDSYFYPIYMWKNKSAKVGKKNKEDDLPHLSQYCEACKAGDCKISYSNNYDSYDENSDYNQYEYSD
jgi:hypothetical protein